MQETIRSDEEVITDININYSTRETKASSWWLIKRADVFVFKENGAKELDSYQRFDSWNASTLKVQSGAGKRKAVVIANSRLSEEKVRRIGSYEDILRLENEFSDDSPDYPLMTGETEITAGSGSTAQVVLTPVMSQIYIPALTCKMSGAYSGKHLTDVKVYLTDISSRAMMMQPESDRPSGILNAGGLSEADLQTLDYSGIVYSYLGNGKKGSGGAYNYGSTSLYCYPNQSQEESAGSPFTRLVVEGTLDGKANFYTVKINREDFGYSTGTPGIGRNVRYAIDLKITGPGASSIDGPITREDEGDEAVQGSVTLHPGNIVTGKDGETVHIWCEVQPDNTEVIFDEDDLDYDRGRGIYDYVLDEDGKGVTLTLLKNGTGMFGIDVGAPVNEGFLVIVVVNP